MIGFIARNLFIDWFGGSVRTTRELLIRLPGRLDIELIPFVDEVYWRVKGGSMDVNVVYKWVDYYRALGVFINDTLLGHYIKGDLHKVWRDLFRKFADYYEVVYDPILMPIAYPKPSFQLLDMLSPHHYLLEYLRYNAKGKAAALIIGSGDVPYSYRWFLKFLSRYFFADPKRVMGIGLFIERTRSLLNALSAFRDRITYLVPSLGVIKEWPIISKHHYAVFYPFYAVDERVRGVKSSYKSQDIVFFARLDITKGVLELPEILYFMIKFGCGVKLKVIGGFESERVRRLFWHRVKRLGVERLIDYIGFIPEDEKTLAFKELASSSVMVYPTHADVIPNVVIEALTLRTPVVMYNVPGPYDAFKGTKAIRFVKEFDTKSMARAVCDLLSLINNGGDVFDDEALRIVNYHSSWDAIVDNFINIIKSMGN